MAKKKQHNTTANAQHAALRTALFRQRVVKPKKGKGSYRRKGREHPQAA